MRKLLLIAAILFHIGAVAQNPPKHGAQLKTLFAEDNGASLTVGQIFNYTTFASLADFANQGSGITLQTGYVQMTGGAATFNDKLSFDLSTNSYRYTCIEDWVMRVGYRTPTTIDNASYGIGIGVDSGATEEYSTSIRWCTDNATNSPNINPVAFYTKRTTNNQVISVERLAPTAGTDYVLQLARAKNVFTFKIFASDGVTQLLTTTFTTSLSTGSLVQPHNTGRFTIQNYGGTNQRITSWSVTSTTPRFPKYIFVGDSNGMLFPVTVAGRYFNQVMTTRSASGVILAGVADRTGDVLLRVNEIIALQPQTVYYNIVSNDIANGVSSATWQANINTFLTAMNTAGIRVVLGTPVARNVDLTAGQTFINGKSGTYTIVDLFATTKQVASTALNATYNSGDGIHLNLAGHNVCATALGAVLP